MESAFHVLTGDEITSLIADIKSIKADEHVFEFNNPDVTGTCYLDDVDRIMVMGVMLSRVQIIFTTHHFEISSDCMSSHGKRICSPRIIHRHHLLIRKNSLFHAVYSL